MENEGGKKFKVCMNYVYMYNIRAKKCSVVMQRNDPPLQNDPWVQSPSSATGRLAQ